MTRAHYGDTVELARNDQELHTDDLVIQRRFPRLAILLPRCTFKADREMLLMNTLSSRKKTHSQSDLKCTQLSQCRGPSSHPTPKPPLSTFLRILAQTAQKLGPFLNSRDAVKVNALKEATMVHSSKAHLGGIHQRKSNNWKTLV